MFALAYSTGIYRVPTVCLTAGTHRCTRPKILPFRGGGRPGTSEQVRVLGGGEGWGGEKWCCVREGWHLASSGESDV